MLTFEKMLYVFICVLQYNTRYYYKIGEVIVGEFWFLTQPQIGLDVAYPFGLIGKLSRIRIDYIFCGFYDLLLR
jgi:hypothetical protein